MNTSTKTTKQPNRRRASVLASAVGMALLLTGVAACGGSSDNDQNAASTGDASTTTITDMVGRQVEIPAEVNTIVPLGNAPRQVAYLGLADKVVGFSSMDLDQVKPVTAYAWAMKDTWKDVPVVGTDAMGATDYYPEQIIEADPDVIICTYPPELADEIQQKTKIPTISVAQGTVFEDDYDEALRMIGEVTGAEDRAEEVIKYIDDSLADLDKRTKNVPEADKPSVLGAGATFKGGHGINGVYVKYPVFKTVNALDVTKDVGGNMMATEVDKEQLIEWNPNTIFLDAGNVGLVRADQQSTPDLFQRLDAFTKGNVYTYPNSTSYYSNIEISLANSYYVGTVLYPEQFSDVNFDNKATEIFDFFLKSPDLLKALQESDYKYGKLTQ